MPFNRIIGFHIGGFNPSEAHSMSIDDKNKELNAILTNRLGQLQAVIEAKEKDLKAMMVPRDVTYIYRTEAHDDEQGQCLGETLYLIGLIKWQGSWRLCHGSVYSPGPDLVDWKPLVDSSVPDRLKAAPELDQLKAKIIESKTDLVPEIEAAIERLAGTLATPSAAATKSKPKPRTKAMPTDKQINEADFVFAVVKDDSDILSVFSNPHMPIEVKEGEPYYRPVSLEVLCNSADELFALQTRVRELRGSEGLYSKEDRSAELQKLIAQDLPSFVKLHEKRMNMRHKEPPSGILAFRMMGDILQYEHGAE